jgi:2-dehydropantoate 2-reductase
VERFVATLREGGVEARASTDIAADLWRKLAFISAMAAGCGLARASIGTVREARYGRLLFERAIREALEVAAARGVAVDRDGDTERILGFVDSLPAPMRPSFLLVLEAGGPNELDDLCGAVARLGRAAGVATPVQDTAVAALSAAAGNLSAARDSL